VLYRDRPWLPNVYGARLERARGRCATGRLQHRAVDDGRRSTVADRLGARRPQLLVSSVVAGLGLVGIILAPDLAFLWVTVLGLALGAIFPLVLTLPLDVADDAARVGSVAALMLLGGYVLSSLGPVVLGTARDLTGDFETSLWLLVAIAILLMVSCTTLSPGRLRRGISREIPVTAAP
jgi:CP family cyanate transporter-like MFS transporter